MLGRKPPSEGEKIFSPNEALTATGDENTGSPHNPEHYLEPANHYEVMLEKMLGHKPTHFTVTFAEAGGQWQVTQTEVLPQGSETVSQPNGNVQTKEELIPASGTIFDVEKNTPVSVPVSSIEMKESK